MVDDASAYKDLLWGVRRSVRYHMRRVRSYDNRSRVATGVAVLFASAAGAAALTNVDQSVAAVLSGVVALISTADLVTNNSRKARDHSDLSRRFVELEQALVSAGPEANNYSEYVKTRLAIEADEPPVMRVLDLLCHNELARAEGHGPEEHYPIVGYERLMAPWSSEFGLTAIFKRKARRDALASREAAADASPQSAAS